MDIREKLGKRLKELRKAAGLSQQRVGEVADVSWQYIGAIERGERAATVDVVQSIAKALGCSVGSLMAAEEIKATREVEELLKDVPSRLRVRFLATIRESVLLLREAAMETSGRRRP